MEKKSYIYTPKKRSHTYIHAIEEKENTICFFVYTKKQNALWFLLLGEKSKEKRDWGNGKWKGKEKRKKEKRRKKKENGKGKANK